MHTPSCCHLPVIQIANYDYGSRVKSIDFHFAPLENLKSTLPYPHRHDFYHIVWVLHGTGHHIIDSVRYEVKPNTLFFMGPGQIHDFVLSDDAAGFTINFSAEFFSFKVQSRNSLTAVPGYDFESINNALYLNHEQAHALLPIIEALSEEYLAEQRGYEDVIWSYLRIFLMKTSRMTEPAAASGASSRSLLLARRFKTLLEKNFILLDETAEYARLLKVTERALNEATRQASGQTASSMIRERIMLEAKRLLLHSEVSVAEVADQLGFGDPAYFSRCFKRHTGRSPIVFRQSLVNLKI
jgi:AraC family transcriptional activator of pobA